MNKNAIFNYVEFAREELQKLVRQKAFEYGITEKGAEANVLIVNGRLLTKEESTQRNTLIKTIESKSKNKFAEGYEIVMEEVSYTWFNRFIALRFMEVNGYLPSHTRVFSDELGKFNPQILKEALTLDIIGIDRLKVSEMLQHNQTDELFKYLLILQCNALSKPMPKMFEKIDNYTELLFPNGLLKKGSIIEKLVNDIPEEDWKEQVQIIGWMYQFYISKKKDEVFASKKTITKNTIGAVTQLFTPDWIVRHMAENSIGRIWLESYPGSPIRNDMKYYVDDAKQEEEVKQQLDGIKYQNIEPEQIKVIEPCCGSGHILVYCFDLLYQMYLEKGYSPKDIASLILKNNLWGLDVDERAVQLAYFSVMMKARSVDRQYLTRDVIQQPRIYQIIDSETVLQYDYEELLTDYKFTNQSINLAKYLVSTYKYGKVIGSLLKVSKYDYKVLTNEIKDKLRTIVPNLMDQNAWFTVLPELQKLAQLAMVMSRKYDVMITNPPYLGSSSLENACKEYANKFYPNSKTDMFAMFMEADLVKPNGYISMINMHGWMFIDSYLDFRRSLVNNYTILNLAHHGIKAFETIGNDIVQTCAFVMKKAYINNFISTFIRLVDVKDYSQKQVEFFNKQYRYHSKVSMFLEAPTIPFAYWVDEAFFENYKDNKTLEHYGELTGAKNITGNNDKYLRQFWEVNFNDICKEKWVPYAKGGFFRKYYGNITNVVDWRKEARTFYLENKTSNLLNERFWYREGITYSAVTSRGTGFRYFPKNCLFDYGGPVINIDSRYIKSFLGFLNSKVASYYFNVINPSVNLQTKDLKSIPYIFENILEVDRLVEEQIQLAKNDWASSETTFEYSRNVLINKALVNGTKKICENAKKLKEDLELNYSRFKENEYSINNIYKELYDLTNFDFEFERRDISIRDFDIKLEIKSLISYFVGISFGRYSLDVEGLAYAGGEWDSSLYSTIIPDENNIIPVLDEGYFVDDLMELLIKFISKVYGEDTLEENLKFISDALGGNGTSKENIRNYLISSFYADHLKTYQKRPIYWLFDAGKQNSFKALIYMHRYTPDLLAKMRTDYILPLLDKYSLRIDFLEKEIPTLTGTMATKSRKELEKLRAQYKELSAYEPKIHHLADQRIEIDLDDGVKHNYELFKEVLAPIK